MILYCLERFMFGKLERIGDYDCFVCYFGEDPFFYIGKLIWK